MDGIYREYADAVYRFLLARTGSPQLAEELTQETFYQAVRSIDRYDGTCRIGTWLCGIAKNVLFTHYRKQRPTVPLDEAPERTAPSAEETALTEMDRQTVLARIDAMPDPGRAILRLRLLDGLSFRQIGKALGGTETWARVSFYRAKQTLVKELKTHDGFDE